MPSPISSAGQPTTCRRTRSAGSTSASAAAASSVAGPDRAVPAGVPDLGQRVHLREQCDAQRRRLAPVRRDEGGCHPGDGRLDAKREVAEPGAVAGARLVLFECQLRVRRHPARQRPRLVRARVHGGEQALPLEFHEVAAVRHPVLNRLDGRRA